MLLKIHTDSPIPIYEQIVTQIIFGIASEELTVGELLPSVRDLAPRLVVNPNTVARAFQELERRGVVVSRRGKGMEVTAAAPGLCRAQRQEIIRGRIREALREAAGSALSATEIRRLVDEELNRVTSKTKATGAS